MTNVESVKKDMEALGTAEKEEILQKAIVNKSSEIKKETINV